MLSNSNRPPRHYCEVYHARHSTMEMDFAVKCYWRERLNPHEVSQVKSEISLHSSVYHPAITSFYGSFEDHRGNVYLVLEYAKNGDAFDVLYSEAYAAVVAAPSAPRGILCETDICRRIIAPLTSAVAYLHARCVVHRDIKPENVLMSDDGLQCKLTDFGFAIDTNVCLATSRMGTFGYMAPEVMMCDRNKRLALRVTGEAGYGKEVDCWAIGILAYECIMGRLPHMATIPMDEMVAWGVHRGMNIDLPDLLDVSSHAKHFVSSCLREDPKLRLTAEQMLSHPWITKHANNAATGEQESSLTPVANHQVGPL